MEDSAGSPQSVAGGNQGPLAGLVGFGDTPDLVSAGVAIPVSPLPASICFVFSLVSFWGSWLRGQGDWEAFMGAGSGSAL